MAKFYNEIIIDMNPESPTFEETLFEDSYDYEGDIMQLQLAGEDLYEEGWQANFEAGEITKSTLEGLSEQDAIERIAEIKYGWRRGSTIANVGQSWNSIRKELYDNYGDIFTPEEFGAGQIGKDDFVDPKTGEMYDYQTIVDTMIAKFPDKEEDEIRRQVQEHMPKYQGVDKDALDFLSKEKDIREAELLSKYGEEGAGGYAGLQRQLDLDKATDVYDLGTKAAGRAYAAEKDVYGAAGDAYGLAQETFGLGTRAAGRAKEAGLGQLQTGAEGLGAQMRGAYGGMGARGGRGALSKLKKGLETTYDVFEDETTRLKGGMGRAESASGRATGAYERAGEAYIDEGNRLTQEKGYATSADEIARKRDLAGYTSATDRADLAQRRSEYGLEQEARRVYEGELGTFVEQGQFLGREGGRVPSKKTFLDILTRLPDAGGS